MIEQETFVDIEWRTLEFFRQDLRLNDSMEDENHKTDNEKKNVEPSGPSAIAFVSCSIDVAAKRSSREQI